MVWLIVQDADMQYLQISFEDVLDKDPDVIWVPSRSSSLKSRPAGRFMRSKAGAVDTI